MGVITTAGLCALLALGSAAAAEPHRTAQDLRYGESLYHYYTGDIPQALTVLLRAQADGGITGHQHYPALMRAGMYLAYGMRNRARAEFAAHLGQGEPPQVRDTAHYYLAQLDYRAGHYTQAAASANTIGDALSDSRQDNLALLNAHLLLKTGPVPNLQAARSTLSPLRQNRALALLNLGNAAARAGNAPRAQQYYRAGLATQLPRAANRHHEALAIRDKTLTALGYSLLGQGDYAAAKAAFRGVRLDSHLANSALLGYGWAAASYHDYVLALKPWQALRRRSLLEPAVQETLLAVPWVYEQLKAPRSALAAYRQSEQRLSAELARIKHTLAGLTSQQVLASLNRRSEPGALLTHGDGRPLQNWLTLNQSTVLDSNSRYLQALLKRDALQEQAQQLRDLRRLQKQRQRWQSKLAVYQQLIADKRQRRAERERQIAHTQLLQRHRELSHKRDALAAQLERIVSTRNAVALAGAETRALAERIARARAALQALGQSASVPANAAERLAFYQGMITWRAAQNFAQHQWQARKALAHVDAAVQQSANRSERIAHMMATASDLNRQTARLTALQARNSAQLQQLDQAVAASSQALLSRIRQTLVNHRNRLQDYLAQTRLSIARLLDAAYRADTSKTDAPTLPEVQE
jgi:enamine deaminase RidA (YjgF/YER057c/UK114 family)